ncbi:MAG: hypothetical protein ACJ74W_04560 [Pyrinomonadaceae bacterium]
MAGAVLVLSLYSWSSIGAVGQTGHTETDKAKQSGCTLHGINFVCPQGFKPLAGDTSTDPVFLFSKRENLGLFITAPTAKIDDQAVNNMLQAVALKFFPKEPQTFKWALKERQGKFSKYDVGGIEIQGFNGRMRLSVQLHHIVFEQKDFFVGYVYELDRGKDAEEMFTQSLGSGNPSGCEAAIRIIYSVTGEKVLESNPPCELVTTLDPTKPPQQ